VDGGVRWRNKFGLFGWEKRLPLWLKGVPKKLASIKFEPKFRRLGSLSKELFFGLKNRKASQN